MPFKYVIHCFKSHLTTPTKREQTYLEVCSRTFFWWKSIVQYKPLSKIANVQVNWSHPIYPCTKQRRTQLFQTELSPNYSKEKVMYFYSSVLRENAVWTKLSTTTKRVTQLMFTWISSCPWKTLISFGKSLKPCHINVTLDTVLLYENHVPPSLKCWVHLNQCSVPFLFPHKPHWKPY